MAIQFTKIKQGRKRFIKTQTINDFINWPTYLYELKSLISKESALQIVDRKVFFEIESGCQNPKLMLEVVGLPIPLNQFNLSISDYEACELLIHKLTGQDIFGMDYEALLETSQGLKRALEASFGKEQGKLSSIFHIVFNQDKIELHFFGQKDYIQKQC
jgi:hypothetical protein